MKVNIRNSKDIEIITLKQLWQNVKKEITTENTKLIDAIDKFERYLY